MNPRERVLAAINHQQPDRVPIELSTTRASGISVKAYENLKRFLGIPWEGESNVRFSQVTIPSERILKHFGVDCRPIFINEPFVSKDKLLPVGIWQDEWGVHRIKPQGGHYYDICSSPLNNDSLTIDDLKNYSWPDPEDAGRVRGIANKYRALKNENQYAVLLHLGADLMLQTQYLRGFEQWFIDFAVNRDLADALLDIVFDYQMLYVKSILDALPGDIDIIYLVDDFAAQNGLLISPDGYRSYLKPKQKKLIEYIKSRSDAKIMLHLCGSLVDVMEDLIEIGIDILNPVQLSSKGMDPESLKSRFGDRMVFWGAVDGQQLMPNGSPDDVINEVRRLVSILGEGGGFVLGPCHNIQYDVPPENICAMYEAAYM